MFFSSFFLFYSLYTLFLKCNTSSFLELSYFIHNGFFSTLLNFFIFLAVISKFGVLGFHLFKAELYKHLKLQNVINFSFFVVFTYLIVICYLFSVCSYIHYNVIYSLFFFLTFFFIIFLLNSMTNFDTILLFFGYSAVLTSTLCLLLVI